MMELTGEVRGVTKMEYHDKPDKFYIVVEDEDLVTYKIGLSPDDITNGVQDQAKKMRGKNCKVAIQPGALVSRGSALMFYRFKGSIKLVNNAA